MMIGFDLYGKCPYRCANKNDVGYCRTTVCINPEHRRINSAVYCLDKKTGIYYLNEEAKNNEDIKNDPDYGIGIYS